MPACGPYVLSVTSRTEGSLRAGPPSLLPECVYCPPPVSATPLQAELSLFCTCLDPPASRCLAPGHSVQLCGLCTVQSQGELWSVNGTPWSGAALCPSRHPYPHWLPAVLLGDVGLVSCTGKIHSPPDHSLLEAETRVPGKKIMVFRKQPAGSERG